MRLYYNPRCSKSRRALALLNDAGHAPEVIDYLATPPVRAELAELIAMLDTPPADLLRETVRAELGAGAENAEQVIARLLAEPAALQRPVLALQGRALIARPPERVFELLDDRTSRP